MDVVALRDPVSSVVARFVPRAGMIGTSLRDGEVELLGQRRGLDAYVADGKTMGIPILYPWANRLGGNTYAAEGAAVTLTPGRNGVRADPNGLPLHGVLAGYPGWRVTAQTANELTAQLDFGADPKLLAGFPFPHLLQVAVRLAGRTLTLTTTVTATGDTAVPVCFGFHPTCSCLACRAPSGSSRPRRCGIWGWTTTGCPPGSPNYSRHGENRCGTRRSMMPTTGSTRARCSRCPAAGAGSRYASSTAIPPRRSSRRRPNPARRRSSASSR